jgi:hypothetical protein
MAKGPKVSKATQTVLDARNLYVKRLRQTVADYGSPSYMTQKVDPRTADMQTAMLTPDQMAAIAQQDPQKAQQLAQRAEQLRQKSEANPPPFSAPGQYEPS